ncbi:MAG: DUF3883 domain-containing protein [Bacteroidales bacterium]|nr:DUF3883 domain-containing protein [Bacteroidales bacterium]
MEKEGIKTMIEISDNLFERVYQEFKIRIEAETNVKLLDYKTHPYVEKNENYKYGVLENAKENLLLKTWKAHEIGKGRIIKSVKNSIQPKYKKYVNNLIDWRKKDDFKKLEPTFQNEKLLFEFFKSKIKDEVAFGRFNEFGFSYQLIAYLFFIKNAQKFMPISQVRFDKIFDYLNLNFHTSHNISWENYSTFNEIIKSFKSHLAKHHKDITLLDAHSFLWMYGFQFCYSEQVLTPTFSNPSQPLLHSEAPESSVVENENQITFLEIHQPKKSLELEQIPDEESEVDFIELHKRFMEIGEKAEDYVLITEKEFLNSQGLNDLADKVRKVSNNPNLGCDIISFEISGKQKQIEVKAISIYNQNKSFIITRNELTKSNMYDNYYVYCVCDVESDEPKIIRLKNPNFNNSDEFLIEPLTFRVWFD